MQIQIRQAALADMINHARDEAPNECCGLLVGGGARIERAVRARNLRASPTRFLVDPVDHFAAIRAARAAGLTIVGAYHSHPDADPVPSAIDIAQSTGRDFLCVIVTPARAHRPGQARAFFLYPGWAEAIELLAMP